MKTEFQKSVEDNFGSILNKYKMHLIDSMLDEEAFGNALLSFASGFFGLRLIRDRGQIFLEVSSPKNPDNWIDIFTIFSKINSEFRTHYEYFEAENEPNKTNMQLKNLAENLSKNSDAISGYFEKNN